MQILLTVLDMILKDEFAHIVGGGLHGGEMDQHLCTVPAIRFNSGGKFWRFTNMIRYFSCP